MTIKLHLKQVGISPRKVMQVCDLLRKKTASDALSTLRFCEKREIAITLTKLINSGLAIANDSSKYDLENLVVDTLYVNAGPTLKRIMPRAQGRAFRIRKRTSNIYLILKEQI